MCTLYERIQALCKSNGVSGSRMCLDLGLSKSTLSDIKSGSIVVIGCSTSEVIGERIGTSGTVDVAKQIFDGLDTVFADKGIFIAAQCCEHLNRAIIIEKEKAEALGLEEVCVVPHPRAGGSFATAAWQTMKAPVAVEEIKELEFGTLPLMIYDSFSEVKNTSFFKVFAKLL